MTDLDGTLLGHKDFSFASIRDDLLELLRPKDKWQYYFHHHYPSLLVQQYIHQPCPL